MDYARFESELIERLKQAGWIESLDFDRQGTSITWSQAGAAHTAAFLEDAARLFPCPTDELKAYLREFGLRHGMVEVSKFEKLKRQAAWMIGDGPFLVITCDSAGRADYALFQGKGDEAVFRTMYAAADEGKEVIVIEAASLKGSKVPRLFPFGARGYWDPDSGTPTPGGTLLWKRP